MSGWYKQLRNLPERAWFRDAEAVQLYVLLKSMAYVSDGRYEDVIIRRGSLPTTRAEMIEATGMRYMKLDRTLKKLISYGEIIVKANSRFSVVTICDYDSLDVSDGLFPSYGEQPTNNQRTTDETANEQPTNSRGDNRRTADEITHLLTIEERRKNKEDILVSSNESYKKERERGETAFEIKKRYNKIFDGKLQPCIRLTMPTKLMVETCVARFGMQAVDMVFDQVQKEPFSLGQNKTGFRASFQYIFTPSNFQQYLERAMLRRSAAEKRCVLRQAAEAQEDAAPTEEQKMSDRKAILEGMVSQLEKNPGSLCGAILQSAYASGELQRLGIEWKPEQQQ